jgi:hypothetical protein
MFQFPEDVLDGELRAVTIVSDLQDISRLVAEVVCERGRQRFGKALKINTKTVIYSC